ncbi:MAG TPA: hypothetical protein VGO03_07235 [Acidimicrobiia bacterium]|jgi:hypothetical protein
MTTAAVAAVPPLGWAAIVVVAVAAICAAVLRFHLLDRLGARLAGEPKARREALAKAGTTDGAKKVARFASMLADSEEVRLIRWTPARTSDGTRIALGASPAAWYLWLAEPSVLLRVPDTLVAKAEHVEIGDGVAELRCEARSGRGYVTATDGTTVEEAENSPALAHSLLDGLVFVDPRNRDEPSIEATPARARPTKVASVSLAS